MKIKFYPAMMAMVEQHEIIEIYNNKLTFERKFGPNLDTQVFEITNEMMKIVNDVKVCESLEEYNDVIEVETNDSIKFTIDKASLSYLTMANLLTTTLSFKYNPRALLTKDVLFYLGDYDKYFEHHYYEEANVMIKDLGLSIDNNKVIINNEVIEIVVDKYKVIKFNTTNILYQAIITTLKYKEQF